MLLLGFYLNETANSLHDELLCVQDGAPLIGDKRLKLA